MTCDNFLTRIDNELVIGLGKGLCLVEGGIQDQCEAYGLDAFHIMFLVCILLGMVVIWQSYITKGQNSLMTFSLWGLLVVIILATFKVI